MVMVMPEPFWALVPVLHHSHQRENILCVQLEFPLVQLVIAGFCPFTADPKKGLALLLL